MSNARRLGVAYMVWSSHWRKIGLILVLLWGLGSILFTAQPQDLAKSPDEVAIAFYKWYLQEIDQGYIPLRQSQARMEEFVSPALLNELQIRNGRSNIDSDYFLKAQDTLEDWSAHVSASPATVNKNGAYTVVTLGSSPESKQRLRVTFIHANVGWRIREVTLMNKTH